MADFVGVAWTGSDEDFQEFVDKYELSFPTISDDAANIYNRFGIPTQPALVVIDPNGEYETLFGAVDESIFDMVIEGSLT